MWDRGREIVVHKHITEGGAENSKMCEQPLAPVLINPVNVHFQIITDQNNINWLQFQGSGKYFKKYLKETTRALEMQNKFTRHAQIALQRIATKVTRFYRFKNSNWGYSRRQSSTPLNLF